MTDDYKYDADLEDGFDDDWDFDDYDEDIDEDECPQCSSINLIREGRCVTCLDCAWSKCSI